MNATVTPLSKKELPNLTIRYRFADSPFARMVLASTDKGLCSVSLVLDSDEKAVERLRKTFAGATLTYAPQPEHDRFLNLFTDESVHLDYHLLGTAFQLDVWKALLDIPLGGTTTYGSLAVRIGRPKAFRAVGSAVGDNPIFFGIPCHRVLPASGVVGNYFWGPAIKKSILVWEKAI